MPIIRMINDFKVRLTPQATLTLNAGLRVNTDEIPKNAWTKLRAKPNLFQEIKLSTVAKDGGAEKDVETADVSKSKKPGAQTPG